MVSVRQRGPRLPKKPQVKRHNRRDPDELGSTYQQSYWYYPHRQVVQGRVKVRNGAADLRARRVIMLR